ncbi:CU044_5270 family protein [Streptosporangium sp. NBC_01755]|uniref:CU044_5270 family protein n=1 Tax=unclassified Streptosporangium TaxID=2632669 RepID=UPI002DDA3D18|nr:MULTISPECIES: CU044_5270 family protein [unclassified Streptosporangium]WSA26813.1 CU044_5270 family protein [Streptosporangium sp. NBC_01810]WSD01762.1 CU044_5270 family protein [Streptosporangium sp. NBC_01755]
MTRLNRLRAEVPHPDLRELRAEERRLLSEIAAHGNARAARPDGRPMNPRGLVRRSLRTSLAVGATAAVITGVVYANLAARPKEPVRVAPMAMSEVLQRAADTASRQDELHPRPGQFLAYESQAMFPVKLEEGRYLDRSMIKLWLPAEGSPLDKGVISVKHLEPEPYPGEPLPAEARRRAGGGGEPSRLEGIDIRPDHLRTDYAHLSRLPTDPAGMREHLYTGLSGGPLDHYEAWGRVGSMITQAYLPAAQRAALFKATGTIPGVETVDGVEDAAGRAGVAAAMANREGGVRHEYIFDPATYLYLGERVVVVDAARAGAPVGSVLTSTALLKVEVADHAPKVAR